MPETWKEIKNTKANKEALNEYSLPLEESWDLVKQWKNQWYIHTQDYRVNAVCSKFEVALNSIWTEGEGVIIW